MKGSVLGVILWKGLALIFLGWFFYTVLGYSVVYSRYLPARLMLVPKDHMSLNETFIHLDNSLTSVCQNQADSAGGIVAGIAWLRSRPQVRVLFNADRWQGILADITRTNIEQGRPG